MEKTLVMIKPDGVDRKLIGLVISEIEYSCLQISKMTLKTLTRSEAEELYLENKDNSLYSRHIDHVISGPVVVIEVTGNHAVALCCKIVEDFRLNFANTIELPKNIAHATSDSSKATEELFAVFGVLS